LSITIEKNKNTDNKDKIYFVDFAIIGLKVKENGDF
jgi:hypothetical protein